MNLLSLITFATFMLASCAGPTNPWGNHGVKLPSEGRVPASFAKGIGSKAKINFTPKRQNLNHLSQFKVTITDELTIAPNSSVILFYNGHDVTNSWLKNSHIHYEQNRKKMIINFNHLKLQSFKDHKILVGYKRDELSHGVFKHYESPSCALNDLEPIGKLTHFEKVDKSLIAQIEGLSASKGVNPSFIAGLIAQESAFNPYAVSHAKAIGLTQVTSLAQHHILESYPHWPQYPQIDDLHVSVIKSLIFTEKVNQQNEWRLNTEYSIRGGINYLLQVEDYWKHPHNAQLIYKHFDNPDSIINDIILASYNSGSFRVKNAIKKLGKNWIQSDQLNEAKKYVNKVKSYCYHFASNHNNDLQENTL